MGFASNWDKIDYTPYKKKNGNYYSHRSIYKRRAKTGVDIALKAYDIVKYVKSLINVEKKWIETTGMAVPVISGGVLYPLTLSNSGTGPNQRVGISTKVLSVSLKYDLLLQNVDSIVRCILFSEDNSQGVAPAVTDLIEVNPPTGNGTVCHYVKSNAGERFKIYSDKVITLNTQNFSNRHCSLFKKFKNHHIKYTVTSTGTQVDLLNQHIYLLFISDQPLPANQPLVTFDARLQYVDN